MLTIGIAVLAGRRAVAARVGIWLGGMLITAGFWYGRNLVHAVNPFPQIDKLGPIDLPGPDQGGFYPREPHKLSEYYNDPDIWQDFFFPVLDDRLGPAVAADPRFCGGRPGRGPDLGGKLADAAARDHRHRRRSRLRLHAADRLRGAWASRPGSTPTCATSRPPLVIGLVLLPLVPALRRRPWPWVADRRLGLLVLQGTFRLDSGGGFPIDPSPSWDFGHLDESLELAILLVGVPAGLVAAARAGVRRWVLVGVGCAALVVAVVLGRHPAGAVPRRPLPGQRRPAARGRLPLDPGVDARSRSSASETTDSRIGVVGRASAFGQYFFYGDDLSNHVQYLGEELRRGTFRQIAQCSSCAARSTRATTTTSWSRPASAARQASRPRSSGSAVTRQRSRSSGPGVPPGTSVTSPGSSSSSGELDPSTCAAAERDFRKAKAQERTAKQAEFAALERSLGEDLDEDGTVGR